MKHMVRLALKISFNRRSFHKTNVIFHVYHLFQEKNIQNKKKKIFKGNEQKSYGDFQAITIFKIKTETSFMYSVFLISPSCDHRNCF